jgi:hypothetical protein
MVILKTLPRLGEFVFPGLKPGKPLNNMAMLSVLKDMNCDESGEPRCSALTKVDGPSALPQLGAAGRTSNDRVEKYTWVEKA